MTLKGKIQNLLGIILALLLYLICFSAVYFFTSFLYSKLGKTPSAFHSQMINCMLSLLIAIIIIKLALILDHKKNGLFDPIITAQNKIAGGDFNVTINKDAEGYELLNDLVDSVNNMAIELGKMEKMRQEFISNVSHEIQSPLTSIRGFAKALRNNNLEADQRQHYIDIIEAESIRLSKLSDNLLKLASLEAETITMEPTSYRLDKQLRKIVLACEPQWSEKNIDMDISLEEVEINADEDMLSQVWINLIHNSIKFTRESGTVSVTLKQQENDVEFTISDTGIGINMDDLPHIYDRFFKADKSRRSSTKGNGLGLSIVRKIIEIHHGTINVQSELGIGTTFIVTLPNG